MRRPPVLAVALAAALAPAPAAFAQDPCSVIRRAAPPHRPGAPRPPLLVGDSSALLAVAPLARLGIEADARGCRQTGPAVDILAARRRAGRLPRVVVLAVGANGTTTAAELRRATRILGPQRRLGLVTTAEPNASAAAMRAYAARHPVTTILIDWAASGLPQRYGGGDPVHVGPRGEAVLARFVYDRVRPYVPPRRRIPFGAAGAKDCAPGVVVLRGADRVLCSRARQLAAARHPAAIGGWLWWDWAFFGRPPWRAVFVRADGRVVVATRTPPPPPASGTRPPGS